MTKGLGARALILTLLITLSPAMAGARGFAWDFARIKGFSGWEVTGATEAEITAGGLGVRGPQPTVFSPALALRAHGKVLRLRVKSPVRGAAAVGLFAGTDIHRKLFEVVPSEGFRDYRIYLGGVTPADDVVDRIVIQFPDTDIMKRPAPLEVAFIGIEEPGVPGLLRAWWGEFWDIEFIDTKAATVSNVNTPRVGPVAFLTALYVFMALVFAAVVAFAALSRRARPAVGGGGAGGGAGGTGGLVARAVFIAFMAGGALYTLRMDYNWLAMWSRDVGALSGKGTRQRIADRFSIYHTDFDVFLDFLDLVKSTVGEGGAVRPAVKPPGDPMAILAKYFLLPVMTSEKAPLLWVFEDDAVYDPASMTLAKGGRTVASPVREVARLGPDAALYERVDRADEPGGPGGPGGPGKGGSP